LKNKELIDINSFANEQDVLSIMRFLNFNLENHLENERIKIKNFKNKNLAIYKEKKILGYNDNNNSENMHSENEMSNNLSRLISDFGVLNDNISIKTMPKPNLYREVINKPDHVNMNKNKVEQDQSFKIEYNSL
jgi:hypothetical protein